MSRFADYQHRWPANIQLERDAAGVVTLTLHTRGGPLLWGAKPGSIHDTFSQAMRELARDAENRVLLLTGSGEAFCAGMAMDELPGPEEPNAWLRLMREGQELLTSLLDLDIPVVAAVNGPALVHAELAVLSDIVLASQTAVFADVAHTLGGVVPGDGVQVVWPLLLGPNRGRHFLLTGQHIGADEAKQLGVVAEVLPPAELLPRARAVAAQLAALPQATTRYSRLTLIQPIKRAMLDGLNHGLALEGLSIAALQASAR